ncbi:MAG TPA: hypothetical protein VFQ65_24805 [Kofleriaceae bacterium]|nr:hypothetical protein [Kofleriaceae bacterium]
MLISETMRDVVLATALTGAAVGLVFSLVYKSPRKPRRRFKGDRPPAQARILGKVSPRVIAARLANLAVVAGVLAALWVRRYSEQVVIVTDAGPNLLAFDKGLSTEAIAVAAGARERHTWWIDNRSSHALRVEKLMYPSSREVIDIPPHGTVQVDHVDLIGPDERPTSSMLSDRYTFWLTWD